ncbi:MAG: hypothetical protein IPP60_01735 [Sphingobacteriales bacterium]|nr:hypothetical protein [Sphingobacteriales bacterium]
MKNTITYLAIIISFNSCNAQNTKKEVFSNGKYEFVFFEKGKYDSAITVLNNFEKGKYHFIIDDLQKMRFDVINAKIDQNDEYIKYISQFQTNYESFSSLDSLEKTSVTQLLDSIIKKIKTNKKVTNPNEILEMKNYYIFWKSSPQFYQKYFYKAPLLSLDLSSDFWNYLYDNYSEFERIITSDINSEDETIYSVYPDQIINHIPSNHALKFYNKLKNDKSLSKFHQTDVSLFLLMLENIATNKWIGFEFDWD